MSAGEESPEAGTLSQDLEAGRAESGSELGAILRRAAPSAEELAEAASPGDRPASAYRAAVRAAHRRAVELAVRDLRAGGLGAPPAAFSFLLLGSHGRGEPHLASDQDHAMVLEDYPDERWGEVEPYFIALSERIVALLAQAGLPRCEGNVMCTNPVWRKRFSEWMEQVRGWCASPDARNVRYAAIFCDFAPALPDDALAGALREDVMRLLARNHNLLRAMYDEACDHRVPLKPFGGFSAPRSGPEKGTVDLKRTGLGYLVEGVRILALRRGIAVTDTVERLRALEAAGALSSGEAGACRAAFGRLYRLLLRAERESLEKGLSPSARLDPGALPEAERYRLREALETVAELQSAVHAAYGSIFF